MTRANPTVDDVVQGAVKRLSLLGVSPDMDMLHQAAEDSVTDICNYINRPHLLPALMKEAELYVIELYNDAKSVGTGGESVTLPVSSISEGDRRVSFDTNAIITLDAYKKGLYARLSGFRRAYR